MISNKESVTQLLKTARGQIDGIMKMIEDGRYCLDVSSQLLATSAILKSANMKVIEGHMSTCVKQAFESGNMDEKIHEIMVLIGKMSK